MSIDISKDSISREAALMEERGFHFWADMLRYLWTQYHAETLHRFLNGFDIADADQRAEHLMQTTIDGCMVGPNNRGTIRAAIARHIKQARAESKAQASNEP